MRDRRRLYELSHCGVDGCDPQHFQQWIRLWRGIEAFFEVKVVIWGVEVHLGVEISSVDLGWSRLVAWLDVVGSK